MITISQYSDKGTGLRGIIYGQDHLVYVKGKPYFPQGIHFVHCLLKPEILVWDL